MSVIATTFSIAARDSTGQLGVAVSSRVPAVGAHCPFILSGVVAISSQAYSNPYLGLDLISRVSDGEEIDAAARSLLADDQGREWRQLIAIGARQAPFAHTGDQTDSWSGHLIGDNCVAAGNLLTGPETIDSMIARFGSASGSLPERLLQALEAGQAAGGDRRGRQSAALLVHAHEQVPYVDLRVDDHPDPIVELRRIWGLYSDERLAQALRTASTRVPLSVEELRARQSALHQQLETGGI